VPIALPSIVVIQVVAEVIPVPPIEGNTQFPQLFRQYYIIIQVCPSIFLKLRQI
jgi:hypothetical protein